MTSQVSAKGDLAPHRALAVSTVTFGFHSSWGGGGILLVSLGREQTVSKGGCSEIGDPPGKSKGPFAAGFPVNGVRSFLSFSSVVMQISGGILTPALALASLPSDPQFTHL